MQGNITRTHIPIQWDYMETHTGIKNKSTHRRIHETITTQTATQCSYMIENWNNHHSWCWGFMKNICNLWQYILREGYNTSYLPVLEILENGLDFYFICGIFTSAINHFGRQISKKNNTSSSLLLCYLSYNNFRLNCRRLWVLVALFL